MNRIYMLTMDCVISSHFELSSFHRARLQKASCEKRKKEIIGSVLLLKRAVADMGEDENKISYGINKNGKPYFESLPYYFNISHSGNMIICAVSDEEIGCDIEKHRPFSPSVAGKYFSPEEIAFAEGSPAAFTRLWVLKESLVKLKGAGLKEIENAVFNFTDGKPSLEGYSFFEFEKEGYSAAVCTANKKDFELIMI